MEANRCDEKKREKRTYTVQKWINLRMKKTKTKTQKKYKDTASRIVANCKHVNIRYIHEVLKNFSISSIKIFYVIFLFKVAHENQ